LISTITRSTGWERKERKATLSFATSSVRFFSFGMANANQRPDRLRTRRMSKPRKPKLPPLTRSTARLFSSLTSSELGQLLAKPSVYLSKQPVTPRLAVHQDHEVVGEARVLDARPLALAGHLLRPLQHAVHLVEVNVTEQGGDHPTLGNALGPSGRQDQLQQVHHVPVLDRPCHLRKKDVVPNVVEVRSQVEIGAPSFFLAKR